jgi:hypothetical protein
MEKALPDSVGIYFIRLCIRHSLYSSPLSRSRLSALKASIKLHLHFSDGAISNAQLPTVRLRTNGIFHGSAAHTHSPLVDRLYSLIHSCVFKASDFSKRRHCRGVSCRSLWPDGLRLGSAVARLLVLRVRIPPRGHGCLTLVSVVRCQVEVSTTNWTLVQRSSTVCVMC